MKYCIYVLLFLCTVLSVGLLADETNANTYTEWMNLLTRRIEATSTADVAVTNVSRVLLLGWRQNGPRGWALRPVIIFSAAEDASSLRLQDPRVMTVTNATIVSALCDLPHEDAMDDVGMFDAWVAGFFARDGDILGVRRYVREHGGAVIADLAGFGLTTPHVARTGLENRKAVGSRQSTNEFQQSSGTEKRAEGASKGALGSALHNKLYGDD